MPSSASLRMTVSTSPTSSGSSAEVGSSKSISFGVHRQRPGDRHPLLLAAGELRRVGVGLVGQAHPLQVVPRDPLGLGLAAPQHPALGELTFSQHRQVREQVELLEDHADPAADRVDVDIGVGDLDRRRRRPRRPSAPPAG